MLRGVIAGAIAGIAKDIPPLFFHLLSSNQHFFPTYWDYAGKISFGKIPVIGWETAYAIVLEVCFSIFMGVLFVHIMPKIQSGLWYVKGAGLGFGIWFLIRMGVSLFGLKEFNQPQIFVSIINVITSISYGILLAYVDRVLQKRS